MAGMSLPTITRDTAPSSAEILARYESMRTVSPSAVYNKGIYDLFVVLPMSGRAFDLSPFQVETTIKKDFKTPYTELGIILKGDVLLRQYLAPGNWVFLFGPYYNNTDPRSFNNIGPTTDRNQNIYKGQYAEIERGQIVEQEHVFQAGNNFTIVARDPAWLLAKNKIPTRIPEGTLTDRLRFWEMLGHLKLRGGSVDTSHKLVETQHKLSMTRGGTNTIWDEIQLDLAETNKVEDKRYVLRHRSGEFYIQDLTQQQRMWAFEYGNNIFSLAHRQSIQDYANVVYTLSNQNTSPLDSFANPAVTPDTTTLESLQLPYTGLAMHAQDIPRYGQHVLIHQDQNTDLAQTGQQQAETLLEKFGKLQETAVLSTYGMAGLNWGDQILVYAPDAQMSGVYWIRGVKHVIADGSSTMSLDVDFDYILPDELRIAETSGANILFDASGNGPPDTSTPEPVAGPTPNDVPAP